MLGEADQAILGVQESIRLAPKSPGSFNNLGTVLKDQGRLAKALPLLQQAVINDPACAARTAACCIA